MTKYTIAIIEDELPSLRLLENMLGNFDFLEILFSGRTVKRSLLAFESHSPDIVFCDVQLPDGNCFDILNSLTKIPKAVCIVTSYSHYAIHAIKYGVVDYILKPLDIEELEQAIGRIINHLNLPKEAISVLENKLLIQDFKGCSIVNEKEILYLKTEDHYTFIYLISGRRILTTYTLKHLEENLSSIFKRIHKSYIANTHHIIMLENGRGGYATMRNGVSIPVAYRRKRALRKALIHIVK